VDDSENDVILMNYALKDLIATLYTKRVDDLNNLKEQLEKERWDVIIVDNSLPNLFLLDALHLIRKLNLKVPIVCISGVDIEETRKICAKYHSEAFVLKDDLKKFSSVVKKIIERE